MGLVDQIIGVESGGDPTAKNPNSSASGAGQFIDSTFLAMVAKHRPDIQGTPQEILALKNDPQLSRQMTEAYAADNGAILKEKGYDANPGNTYLAHFAGPQGAVSVLSADPNAPVSAILGDAAVKANPFLQRMTAGDLQAWAAKKMGGAPQQPPQQTAQASPQSPPSAPLQASPTAPPIFPPQQQPPQQAQQGGGSLFGQMPADQGMQAPPIFYAPRKPPNIQQLQAALQASGNRGLPIFGRG